MLISSFPADINRDYFGAWLSGFTDGEGCFRLIVTEDRNRLSAEFGIKLREDDRAVLALIQSYLSCGALYVHRREKMSSSPQLTFRIAKVSDLINTVIPHFDQFPLMAKKQHDFQIWKLGVKLLYAVGCRPVRGRGAAGGRYSNWTEEERQQFRHLKNLLHEERQYR